MDTQEIIAISKAVDDLKKSTAKALLICQKNRSLILILNDNIQNLLDLHKEFPEVFRTNQELKECLAKFRDASKKLGNAIVSHGILNENFLKPLEDIKTKLSPAAKTTELIFFKKNIGKKIQLVELDMQEIKVLGRQSSYYIEKHTQAITLMTKISDLH